MLPRDIDEARIRRLRLGDATDDILLRRHESDVAVNVIQRRNTLRVAVVN